MRSAASVVTLHAIVLLSAFCVGQEATSSGRAVVRKVVPVYPELARQMRLEGSVKFEAVVKEDGSIKSLTAKGGHPVLLNAAETAIRQWKFAAAPQTTTETVEIRFNP